jgi:hypothetical protein
MMNNTKREKRILRVQIDKDLLSKLENATQGYGGVVAFAEKNKIKRWVIAEAKYSGKGIPRYIEMIEKALNGK